VPAGNVPAGDGDGPPARKPGDLSEVSKAAIEGFSEEQKASIVTGADMYAKFDSSFLLEIVGFYYPKFRVDELQESWRAQGLLDSRPLHELSGMKRGFTLPEGLGFYLAPSNCPVYYANHFNKLAKAANAEFTEHWAMQGEELVPTFTYCLMSTRKLEAGEQILVDYGPDFATLEPFDYGDTTDDAESPATGKQLTLTMVPESTKPVAKPKSAAKSAKRKLDVDPPPPAGETETAPPASKKGKKAAKVTAPKQSSGTMEDTPPRD
jgi:hypothetical protein